MSDNAINKRVDSHFEYAVDPDTGDIMFKGRVSRFDLTSMTFDPVDRAVLNGPIKTAADAAQNLEIIFFRMQQQLGKPSNG